MMQSRCPNRSLHLSGTACTSFVTVLSVSLKQITMSSSPFAVQSIDHVVLTVASIQATVDFYTKHLGMTHETFVSGEGVER